MDQKMSGPTPLSAPSRSVIPPPPRRSGVCVWQVCIVRATACVRIPTVEMTAGQCGGRRGSEMLQMAPTDRHFPCHNDPAAH